MIELIYSLFLLCWLTLLPGLAIVYRLPLAGCRRFSTRCAIGFAVGFAFWPLVLLWTTTIGFQLSSVVGWWILFGVGALSVILLASCGREWRLPLRHLHRLRRQRSNSPANADTPSIDPLAYKDPYRKILQNIAWALCTLLLFAFTLWTRHQHIATLVIPNWVDSVHHTLIVRLLAERGYIPDTFAPFMPSGEFLYHWGYHAVMAWGAWLRGSLDPFEISQHLLLTGQALSMVAVFMLYVSGRWLFNSRRAGVFVAILGGLVSWFPAYYVSWGRYTHLAGVLLMAPLCYGLWRCHTSKVNAWGWIVVTSLISAGLLLTHVRVTVFVGLWAVALAVCMLWRKEWRTLTRWALSALGALLLTAPWLWRLATFEKTSDLSVVAEEAQQTWWNAMNNVSWSLLWVPGIHEVVLYATGGLSSFLEWGGSKENLQVLGYVWFGLTATAVLLYGWQWLVQRHVVPNGATSLGATPRLRGVRWPKPPIASMGLLVLWCCLTIVLLNLDKLGLPAFGFLTNNAAVITAFAPFSLIAGGVAAWVTGMLIPRSWIALSMVLIVAIMGGVGSLQMQTVVNPTTTLVRPQDMNALRWIRESTPPDALFAVNVKPWLGDTYAGSDAGYWIPVLSNRNTFLPPALYTSVMPYDEVMQMNQFFAAWSQINELDNPDVRKQLKTMGVTHIYLGSRGGNLVLPTFFDKPYVRPVFAEGGVHIYELLE